MILRVEGLSRSFGGLHAVDDVSLRVDVGDITGLIGPNGAGKSTTFNLIAGALRPDGGRIAFEDRDVTGWPPDRVARLGLIRTYQIPRVFERMTVLENMLLCSAERAESRLRPAVVHPFRSRSREKHLAALAMDELLRLQLDHLAGDFAGVLSGGQRKLLTFGMALMARPRLLLLDEPAAGVNPTLAGEIAGLIRRLNEGGMTILVIEHNLAFLERIANRVVVMAGGRVLAEGTLAEIRKNQEVLHAYLGTTKQRNGRTGSNLIDERG